MRPGIRVRNRQMDIRDRCAGRIKHPTRQRGPEYLGKRNARKQCQQTDGSFHGDLLSQKRLAPTCKPVNRVLVFIGNFWQLATSNSTMRNKLTHSFLTAVLLLHFEPSLTAADYYAFAYFKEPARSGIYYALSTDGYRWTPVNGGNPVWAPQYPKELMRDIFITRGPDHQFHAVWTWGWREKVIGYAHSSDLIHWSSQVRVPLMEGIPGTIHTWAPEIYWDGQRREWLIIWSSIAEGETRNRIYSSFTRDFVTFSPPSVFFDPGYDVIDATILHAQGETRNRIYSSFTRDFVTFSPPSVFFDPGYDVIDATILHAQKRYYLIFKDQTKVPLTYKLRMADSHSLEGPWSHITDTLTESWSEGPSAIRIGRYYFLYYDHYRPAPNHEVRRYEALRSSDLKHWEEIDDQISFPAGCKHGSFFKLTQAEAQRLKALPASAVSQ